MRIGSTYRVLDEDEGLATPPPQARHIRRRRPTAARAARARFVGWMLAAVVLTAGFVAALLAHQPALAIVDGLGLVAVAKILVDGKRFAPPQVQGEKPLAGPNVVWRAVRRRRPT